MSVAEEECKKKKYLNQYDAGKYVASDAEGTPIEVWVALFRELEPYVEKFVESKYYTKPMTTAKQKYPDLMRLCNTIDNSRSLREVFLSMSIQHGQYNVVSHFAEIYYALPDEGKTIDESTLIHSVYNYRKLNILDLLNGMNENNYWQLICFDWRQRQNNAVQRGINDDTHCCAI